MLTEKVLEQPPRPKRRERVRIELRDRIVQTALTIAQSDGWANVSMRGIAEAIEYSAPALYHHFDGREDLIQQIRKHGYQLFHARLATIDDRDPVQRLLAMTIQHVDFAFENPELFSAMFGLRGALPLTGEALPEQRLIGEMIDGAVREILGKDVATPEYNDAIDMIWASVHGIVSLALYGAISGGIERARGMSLLAMKFLLKSLAESAGGSGANAHRPVQPD